MPSSSLTPEMEAGIARATEKANELNRRSAEGPVPRFCYDQLVPGWIRVIDLAPGVGDEPIICSLSQQPLKGPEAYEAISYVWGDQDRRHSITCNWRVPIIYDNDFAYMVPQQVTENFKITDNLSKLLWHLRLSDRPRRLWVDQICINQDHQAEKAAQIKVMAEIYAGASRVVIWLGDAATAAAAGHDVDQVFGAIDMCSILQDLDPRERGEFFAWLFNDKPSLDDGWSVALQPSPDGQPIPADEDSLRQRFLALGPPSHIEEMEQMGYRGIHFDGLRHLNHFLESTPWFRRAWTFQESVMGRQAMIMYGDWSRGWDALCKACQFLVSQTTYYGSDWQKLPARSVAESVVRRGQFRQDFALLQNLADPQLLGTPVFHQAMEKAKGFDRMGFMKRARLKALLPELRPTQAMEPIDKVLALTGFAHDDGQKVAFPNGKDEVEMLYLTVIKYWITTQEDTPYLLSHGFRSERTEPLMWDEWPSPLVVEKPELSFLSHLGEAKHTLPSWVPDWDSPLEATPLLSFEGFHAATGWVEPASIVSVGKEHRLLLKGIPVGTVSAVVPDMADLDGHAKMLDAFVDPHPTTGMSYLDVYKAIASPVASGLAAEPERPQACAGFWDPKTEVGVSKTPASPRPPRYTAGDLQGALDPLRLGACQQPEQPHLTGRALFSLGGGLLGLGPKRTAVGDVVYVIAGAAVPFALRAKPDGTFTVLGECFTFGVMHGEVLEALPEGKVQDLVLV
ncbi:hypothetical protein VTI74DRAFT_9020 [Chaetomium olivicolor]